MSITLPEIGTYGNYSSGNYGAHCLRVDIGPIRLWFSYQTVIAFQVDGHARVVHQNDWGTTTGKHLNAIDGGDAKSSQGRIIMVSSVTGHVMAMKNQPIYATAKAAMVGLSKSIAIDEASYGITCNAVLPGWIATDVISADEKSLGSTVPLGRGGKPEEVASLIAWLATSEASYITGQAIVIDGGNSIAEERH